MNSRINDTKYFLGELWKNILSTLQDGITTSTNQKCAELSVTDSSAT